uniref:TTF-type domain-containing protein n=1 Tax=Amphimedon queenslandica TaxID=400682 RepID=A0A1X7VWZ2_AMPQE
MQSEERVSSSGAEQHLPNDIAQHKSDSPHQPSGITFPARMFGSSKRSFQASWYADYSWLEYSIERDSVYCFPCRFFGIAADQSLTRVGFSDWKHARGKSGTLTGHDTSCSKHHLAVLSWKEYQSTVANNSSVAVQLDRCRLQMIEENRLYVKIIFAAILFCCQQGIALRGHREVIDSDDYSVNVGNFRALMVLFSRSIDIVKQRMFNGPKNATWLAKDIQNSVISLLAESVSSMIREESRVARYYTIIADETKDVSKTEQLALVLRYVLDGKTHERFISFTKCEELDAEAIFTYIMTGLRDTGVDISNCISQCYDGASVMSGHLSGVRKRVTDLNPAAIYIHCHAHQLNLVLVDTCKKVDHAASFFSLLECVYVFLSSSVPHSLFMAKQKELHFTREIQLKKLSDARWSCRHSSIKAVLTTIQALLLTLEELSEDNNTRSIEARGLLHQVSSFQFLLSLILFERIFSISNNLSTLLQSQKISYAAAASCIKGTMLTIANLRSDDEWSQIWAQAVSMAEKCSITVTPLRQRRSNRLPKQLDSFVVDSSVGTRPVNTTDEYKTQVYYATIDAIVEEMDERFSELNLSLLKSLEPLIPNSSSFLDLTVLKPVLNHYNISEAAIVAEVSTVKIFLDERDPDSSSLHDAYQQLSKVPECFPTVIQCYQIAMTIGVSSATAERSFSSLRKVKTYLRSTMTQDRLSNLALLYIERSLSSKLWDKLDELVIKFAETHKNSRIVLL